MDETITIKRRVYQARMAELDNAKARLAEAEAGLERIARAAEERVGAMDAHINSAWVASNAREALRKARLAHSAPTGAGGNAKAFVCCEGIGAHAHGCTAVSAPAVHECNWVPSSSIAEDTCTICHKYRPRTARSASVTPAKGNAGVIDSASLDEGRCDLCGEPMPPGETMFRFHGYSGPCPEKP